MTRDDPRYRWRVLVVVMIGTVMSALDSSIVNVALPDMMASFGASVDDVQWVVTAYMLGFATLMPLTAWIRGRIGHRWLYLMSLAVFVGGSVLCGFAWSLGALVVARVIQALGGGAITPTGMAMIAEVFPPEERGRALGAWTVGVILGPAVGPTLGGYLTESLGWRSIFDINLPIGIVALIMAARILERDVPKHASKQRFDFAGFVLLTVFLVSGLLALAQGNEEGWTSRYIITCGLLSIFSFVGFLVVESVSESRILDLGLFRHTQFGVAFAVTTVRSVALYGGTFLLPLFMQQNMGLDEVHAGALLFPGALMIGLLSPVAGRLLEHTGPRILTLVGLVLTAVFMFLYRDLDATTSTWGVLWPTLVRGVGLGLLVTPVTAAGMNSVPTSEAGMASSMLSLVQQVGGSVGIALLATVLSTRTTFHLAVVGERMHSASPSSAALVAHLRDIGYSPADAVRASQVLLGQHAASTASVAAFDDAFLVGGAIVLIGLIPALFLAPLRRGAVAPVHDVD